MRKSVTKIVKAVLGFTMAIGAFVGAAMSNPKSNRIHATETEGSTQTLVITRNSFGSGSGYSVASFTQNTSGGTSISGSGQIYLSNADAMQFNKGQGVGAIWNSVAIPGTITSISAKTASGTNRAWNAWVSSTAYSCSGTTLTAGSNATKLNNSAVTVTTSQTTIGSSSHGYSYFALIENVNNASYLQNITITYTAHVSTKDDVELSCSNLDLDVSGGASALSVTATSGGNAVDNLSYSYSVVDPSVATVSNLGVVTPVSIGSTNLTISFAGDEDYNEASTTITVTVSENTLNSSTLVFGDACGGTGTADDGSEWTITSDADESVFDSTYGIHYGTGSASVTYVQLSTADIVGSIQRVTIRARDAQEAATISVSVGGVDFTCSGSDTVMNVGANYVFTGAAKGEIVVRIDRGSSNTKAIYVKSIIVNYSEVTLSNITLSGTYPIEFTQGDEFSHAGMVVTASYSDSTSAVVTETATWSGYNMAAVGVQTVIVSYSDSFGTASKTYSITVNAPVEPIIILSVPSISGYTGEAFAVTATYSNLTSAFAWGLPSGSGSISGSVTSTTGTSTDGSSTYSGTLTGAGSVTLTTSGGGVAEAPSVAFTITLSTVTISGLPTKKVIAIGDQIDLSSTITVTSNGTWSENVNWDTSNGAVATVSNGVVTALTEGKTNITVASDDYPSANMTCSVIVIKTSTIELTDANLLGYAGENVAYPDDEDPTSVTISGAGIDAIGCGAYGDGIQMRTKSGKPTSVIYSTTKLDIFRINFVWAETKDVPTGKDYHLFVDFSNKADFSVLVGTRQQIKIDESTKLGEAVPTAPAKYFRITHANQGAVYLDAIKIVCEKSAYLNSAVSTATLLGNETGSGVESVAMKFSAKISVADLTAAGTISDYGIMVFKRKAVDSAYSDTPTPIKDAYRDGNTLTVFRKGSGDIVADDNYYIFSANVNVKNSANYGVVVCAAPFVVIGGTYYFFDEMEYSVNTLAQYHLVNGGSSLSEDALNTLKGA